MMKMHILLIAFAMSIVSTPWAFCQEQPPATQAFKTIPAISVKNFQRLPVSTSSALQNDGKPVLLNFWATWCKPCISELTTWSALYGEWQKQTGVKIIAVSIDDARNVTKVIPFVRSRAWDFDILFDENGDFRRAMNVNPIPHSFILNGKGEIVWQHISYAQGDEEDILRVLKSVAEGKTP
jgi:cytochrome c biogenesis protein CcmG, thiol:disulfide interchange protein DsbE